MNVKTNVYKIRKLTNKNRFPKDTIQNSPNSTGTVPYMRRNRIRATNFACITANDSVRLSIAFKRQKEFIQNRKKKEKKRRNSKIATAAQQHITKTYYTIDFNQGKYNLLLLNGGCECFCVCVDDSARCVLCVDIWTHALS